MKTSDMPAFPHPSGAQGCDGLTKLEWFAGQALVGVCANNTFLDELQKEAALRGVPFTRAVAFSCCGFAEAIIAEIKRATP